ncbi:hypothetical protein M9Y10_031630 [Tritrichomonas musculus]|uniref:HECT-type E3 ubiquitin transferase n=1 Tax=Tritrichomonas musculus TaxID=1915356 RepID=A0ABR2H258_9EUKA
MSSDTIGITFSSDAYETIQMLLEADQEYQLEGLRCLSNILMYGNAELLSDFPCNKMAKDIVNILSAESDEQLTVLSAQCIYQFLEAHPDSTKALINNQALPAISKYLVKDKPNSEAAHYLIKSLEVISTYRPNDVAKEVKISPFLEIFNKLTNLDKKSAAQSMVKVTENFVDDTFSTSLSELMNMYLTLEDPVKASAILTFRNIVNKLDDKGKVPIEIVPQLVDAINVCNNGTCAIPILQSLSTLTQKDNFAELILSRGINYRRLLFEANFEHKSEEIKRLALNVIVNLLPDTELPNDYWLRNNRKLKGTDKFAKDIQPLLVEIILSKAGWETLSLAALAATMIVCPLNFNDDLLNAIAGLVQTPLFSAFVLLVIIHLPDPSIIVKAGILPLIKNAKPDNEIVDWYNRTLDEFLKKLGPEANSKINIKSDFRNFESLCLYVMQTEIKPYEFSMSGLLSKASSFLSEIKEKEARNELSAPLKSTSKNAKALNDPLIVPAYLPALGKMVDLSLTLLNYLPIPRVVDPLSSYTPDELLTRTIKCEIKTPEDNINDITVGIDLDFCGLEAWYNAKKSRCSKDDILPTLRKSPYKDIVIIENPDDLFFTQKGLLYRMLEMPNMKRYHFKIGNNEYSAYDSFFPSIVRSIDEPKKITSALPIEFIEGDSPRAPLNVPKNIHEQTLSVLNFLELIHHLCPSFNLHNKNFTHRIISQMSSPMLTMGFISTASQIFYHYPFLFDFEIRQVFFRIIGLDLSYSLPFINNYFFKVPWNNRMNSMRVKCHIRRDSLFEDGMKMLKAVGPGLLRIDVFFDNEEGIGAGPTQEFLTLFSKELCRTSRGLWRYDFTSNNELAFMEKGLFPKPDADPKLFYILGLLFGKAILMDMILPLPMNPCFFRLIRGDGNPNIYDIDEQLATSLDQYPEGLIGLNFTYPGLPNFELCKKGEKKEVTKKNLKEYVELVKKATIELPDIVKAFREAFSTIIQWETLKIFSDEELCLLIEGQNVLIKPEDLKNHVDISHGYDENSPQIKFLFETILEMNRDEQTLLIKFITGCAKLPIGGLQSLKPKLTIALRVPIDGQKPDECLPSVLTCANYLKIPKYSSKKILKEKLLIAINECQGSFLLT